MTATRISMPNSGIYDNYYGDKVGDFLRSNIRPGSSLSIVSAYFMIYAYAALNEQLDQIASLRFLFGEPRFLRSVDPDRDPGKAFDITDDGLHLMNQLQAPSRIVPDRLAIPKKGSGDLDIFPKREYTA